MLFELKSVVQSILQQTVDYKLSPKINFVIKTK